MYMYNVHVRALKGLERMLRKGFPMYTHYGHVGPYILVESLPTF